MVAFAKAIKTPTSIALPNPSTRTPGIKNAANKTAKPITKISIISFILYFYNMWRLNIIILLFLGASCQFKAGNLLADEIEITNDACCIVIKNIDNTIIEQLITDSLTQEQWQSNMAIYQKTDNEDLQDLEKPILGAYRVENEQLIFKPIQAFKKGEYYLVELYLQNPEHGLLSKLKQSNSPFGQQAIQKTIKF